ncbi:HxlR family transcriptional regulator [Mycobacterium sp. 852013-50091_SCH5140682]|uniref:winged helix-turn-helix transcriptional regulator n=1 Tax=Mycobacterium sp. 852013-50091_SCH5140682 TaxID=1834109 RepID=UPI0007EC1D83|nr:helix-turn-helix domain-containing protein [Mycobacterium sp. 852013-50091_SCH5140682]OBC00097.1 HxlR family transcriptional regulator [Mycobacterium sp. 852013-50091_SCH5140682]
MRYDSLADERCSILRPLALLGDRWTLVILRQAFAGVRRFDDFQATLGLSRALLTERLGRLVDAEILERRAYRDAQRTRHEYRLTTKGSELYPVLMALRDWGDKYLAPNGPFVHYRHKGCGGSAHTNLTCDQCATELTAFDVEVSPGPGLAAG